MTNQNNRPHKPARPHDSTAFDLLLMLRGNSSCPVCVSVRNLMNKYLDWIAYESVTDPATRERLRGALGYCAVHGQQWLEQSDALGTALIYEDIFLQVGKVLDGNLDAANGTTGNSSDGFMDKLRTRLGNGKRGTAVGALLAAALAPKEACPACVYLLEVEGRLVKAFAGALDNDEFMDEFSRHRVGLCLPHLRAVMPQIADEATLMQTLRAYRANMESTRLELEEVARKNDHRYMAEERGAEFSAPARSVEQAGGLLPTQLNLPA